MQVQHRSISAPGRLESETVWRWEASVETIAWLQCSRLQRTGSKLEECSNRLEERTKKLEHRTKCVFDRLFEVFEHTCLS